MFRLILACSLVAMMANANAQTYVNGYVRSNGTYVQPHLRSKPDGNTFNNYSSQGNLNPYTGQKGEKNPLNTTNTGWSIVEQNSKDSDIQNNFNND